MQEQWQRHNQAWKEFGACKQIWYISATASMNAKANAGAESGALLEKARLLDKLPWPLKSNINPLIVKIKKQTLIFMPDKLLIWDGAKLGAISYEDIDFKFGIQPYVGQIQVPKETEILEYRWLKSNKDGTPDKRFKGNRQIPVYKLGAIYMTSASGLNVS